MKSFEVKNLERENKKQLECDEITYFPGGKPIVPRALPLQKRGDGKYIAGTTPKSSLNARDKKTDEKSESKRLTGRTKINVLHASKTTSNHKRETAEKTSEPASMSPAKAGAPVVSTAAAVCGHAVV